MNKIATDSDTPLDFSDTLSQPTSQSHFDSNFLQVLAQELAKINKGKSTMDKAFARFAGSSQVAGNLAPTTICCNVQSSSTSSSIIDTGASGHMCLSLSLFHDIFTLSRPVQVVLPDGSIKQFTTAGKVHLSDKIMHQVVLYIPELKYNLLSVIKLLNDEQLSLHIYPNQRLFQDLLTKDTVASIAPSPGLLRFHSAAGRTAAVNSSITQSASSVHSASNSLHLLHARLGHTSISKMVHVAD